MIQLDHQRRAGYLLAWKQIGLQQTLGPALSRSRRLWLQTGRRLWIVVAAWRVPTVGRLAKNCRVERLS